jgi:hypothetical protein
MPVRAVASLLVVAVASSAAAQSWRTVDVSRQLLDTTDHRIRVKYAAGRFSMRPTNEPILFSMQLRYDEDRSEPLHRYDANVRSATLGLEGRSIRWTRHFDDQDAGEMHLALSNAVPMDLDVTLGASEARVDAGDLALKSLRFETGAADAVLDFSAPNRSRMRRLDIQVGAAAFAVRNLANANVSAVHVQGGVGSVELDFGAVLKEDVNVDAEMALGKLHVRVPRDVGVRVELQRVLASFDHPGLQKRGNAYYSDNWDSASVRVKVRTQTVFGAVEIDRR